MAAADAAIIFVPGIRAKPDPLLHAAELRRCITAGVMQAGGSDAEAAAIAGAFDLVGWSYHFYGAHGDIEPELSGIEALLANAGNPDTDRAEALGIGHRFTAAMYAIGDMFPGLGSLFATRRMETRLAEINRYFLNQQGEGAHIRQMLVDRLQAAWDEGNKIVLIGHSFGSVIAYDTLWELTHVQQNPGRIDLFVSMGSPLALRYIRRRLKGSDQPHGVLGYPGNINRWVNLTAVGEVTALDRRMADSYAEMRRLGLVDSITDNLNLLNRFRGPDGLNVHKCYGYFASAAVGQMLLDWYRTR